MGQDFNHAQTWQYNLVLGVWVCVCVCTLRCCFDDNINLLEHQTLRICIIAPDNDMETTQLGDV